MCTLCIESEGLKYQSIGSEYVSRFEPDIYLRFSGSLLTRSLNQNKRVLSVLILCARCSRSTTGVVLYIFVCAIVTYVLCGNELALLGLSI